MPFRIFERFEDDSSVGVECIAYDEVAGRLKACSGTSTRLAEICPLPLWMTDLEQLSFFNSIKTRVTREQVTGIIENNNPTSSSNVLTVLRARFDRAALESEVLSAPAQQNPSAIFVSQSTVAAFRRELASEVQQEAEICQATLADTSRERNWLQRTFGHASD